MRPDIVSVYTEPVQHARRAELFVSGGRTRDPDDLPSLEGMAAGKRRGWNRKEWRYRSYSVVRRFLRSAAGRPWADVWSGVCRAAGDGAVGMEFRHAVLGEVETVRWVDARGHVRGGSDGGPGSPLHDFAIRHGGSYVDEGGILRFVEKSPRRAREPIADPDGPVRIGPFRELRKVGGTWFEVTYGPYAVPPPRPKGFKGVPPRVEGGTSPWARRGAPLVMLSEPLSKRSLSGAELRARGLRNSEPEPL